MPTRETLHIERRPAFLIASQTPAVNGTGKAWVWYAPTLGHNLPGDEEQWMFRRLLAAGVTLLIAALLIHVSGVRAMANLEDLDGVTGKVFRADVDAREFELLKETVFDPQTDEGRSRHTVYWDEKTRFMRVDQQNSFEGLKGSYTAHITGLSEENAEKAAAGEPFVCLNVTLLAEGDDPDRFETGMSSLLIPLSPIEASAKHRDAAVTIDGKPSLVRLPGPRAQVDIRTHAGEDLLREGFWKTRVYGSRHADGRFIATQIDLHPRVDPRTEDDPELPRVLIIGDSISMNYFEAAKTALAGVANVHRNDGNAGPSDRGVNNTVLWLGDFTQPGLHWDVIQFNHGLHDLKQMYDADAQAYGKHQVSVEQYKANLAKQIVLLKRTGATLMWCDTTPVPSSSVGVWDGVKMGRQHGEDKVFNAAAREVLKDHPDILINELGNAVTRDEPFEKWWDGTDVHFWDGKQQKAVGQYVAEQIKRALDVRAQREAGIE